MFWGGKQSIDSGVFLPLQRADTAPDTARLTRRMGALRNYLWHAASDQRSLTPTRTFLVGV